MDEVARLTDTSAGWLEARLSRSYLDPADLILAAGCTLDRNPTESNWVQDAGGLPEYICEIARSIHTKRGKSISNAIQIAVGVVKRWAKGVGDVDADTRAKAAAAVAQWETKKARARATPNKRS